MNDLADDLTGDENAHRVVWLAPQRPVEGGTVFVRPTDEIPGEVAAL